MKRKAIIAAAAIVVLCGAIFGGLAIRQHHIDANPPLPLSDMTPEQAVRFLKAHGVKIPEEYIGWIQGPPSVRSYIVWVETHPGESLLYWINPSGEIASADFYRSLQKVVEEYIAGYHARHGG